MSQFFCFQLPSGDVQVPESIAMLIPIVKDRRITNYVIKCKLPPAFLELVIDYLRNQYSISWLKSQLETKWDSVDQITEWFKKLGFNVYQMGLYNFPFPEKVQGRTIIVDVKQLSRHGHDHNDNCQRSEHFEKTKSVFVLPGDKYLSCSSGLKPSDTVHYVRAEEVVIDGKLDYYLVRHPEYSNQLDIPLDQVIKVNGWYFMKMEDYLKHNFSSSYELKKLFEDVESHEQTSQTKKAKKPYSKMNQFVHDTDSDDSVVDNF